MNFQHQTHQTSLGERAHELRKWINAPFRMASKSAKRLHPKRNGAKRRARSSSHRALRQRHSISVRHDDDARPDPTTASPTTASPTLRTSKRSTRISKLSVIHKA